MYTSSQKRSAATLAVWARNFEKDGTDLSLTCDAGSAEAVDMNVAEALPRIKRMQLFLEDAECHMVEWQRMRAPDGMFLCEHCDKVLPSAVLMYPILKEGWLHHGCKQWPRWCNRCVADELPKQCPGEGCSQIVHWTGGGNEFFVHVKVSKKTGKHTEEVVAHFGLFVDPAVTKLRDLKQAVADKAKVPVADLNCKLKGVDKTLSELGLVRGSVVEVLCKADA